MNDDVNTREVLDVVKAAVPAVRMHTPVQHIASAARSRRRRRGLAGLTGTGLAVAVGLVLGLSAAGAGHSAPGAQAGSARLAGWTVRTNADGTVTVTLRQLMDQAALQQVLAAHGIPAIVHAGVTMCQEADGDGPPGLQRVVSRPHVAGTYHGWRSLEIDIRPAAMPSGSKLLFNIMLDQDGVVGSVGSELIYAGAPMECLTPPPPSTAPSQVLTPPAKG